MVMDNVEEVNKHTLVFKMYLKTAFWTYDDSIGITQDFSAENNLYIPKLAMQLNGVVLKIQILV
jgi:hypothetical protein